MTTYGTQLEFVPDDVHADVRLILLEPEIVSFDPDDIQHDYFDAFFPLQLG